MGNWDNVELGSVCEVVRGGSPRPIIDYITDDPDGVNWLKIGDVKETDKFFTHAAERIKRSGIPKTREVHAGDLILSNSMSFGRAFMTLIDGYIHDGWLRLRCNEERLDKEYLYYFLTSNLAQNQFKAVATGSVVNNLKSDTVKAVRIDLPPLEEQRRIAAMLSMIDDKIKCNEVINQNLLQQALCLFEEEFVTKADIDEELPLYHFADYINGAAFKPDELGDVGLPVIKIAELKAGITGSTRFFSGDKGRKYLVHNKDILFSWSGNPETSIDLFVWSEGEGVLNQHTFNVKSKYGCPWFTFLMLKYHKPAFTHIASNKQTTGLGHVTAADLKRLTFPFDLERMKDFEATVAPIMDLLYGNLLENRELSSLRDTLLPQMMSGELDVSKLDI